MPCNSEDILDSDSEHDSQTDVNVLPTFVPQTPAQIQYYKSSYQSYYPFPFYAFSQHANPFAFTQIPYTSLNFENPHRVQAPVSHSTSAVSPFPISGVNLQKATTARR